MLSPSDLPELSERARIKTASYTYCCPYTRRAWQRLSLGSTALPNNTQHWWALSATYCSVGNGEAGACRTLAVVFRHVVVYIRWSRSVRASYRSNVVVQVRFGVDGQRLWHRVIARLLGRDGILRVIACRSIPPPVQAMRVQGKLPSKIVRESPRPAALERTRRRKAESLFTKLTRVSVCLFCFFLEGEMWCLDRR